MGAAQTRKPLKRLDLNFKIIQLNLCTKLQFPLVFDKIDLSNHKTTTTAETAVIVLYFIDLGKE